MPGPHVELTRVTKRYGAATAISDLRLAAEKGSSTALLGPSGYAKPGQLVGLALSERGVHLFGAPGASL